MKFKNPTITIASFTLALVICAGAAAASVSASDGRNGRIHITKDCTPFNGMAGGHCTIASSNLPEIPPDSNVYYDQSFGVPAGMLDSNVVLDAGNGNRAVGRCTLDGSTGLGLCTFSDGTGQLAGFTARINVSPLGGKLWAWEGTYRFKSLPER
jgi:hypothetical protein